MQKSLKNARRRPTRKTAFRRGTINKKRQKQPFVGVRRTKSAENRLSAMAEEQKTAKKCVSATAEEQKTVKREFRPRPKLKKQRKTAFPLSGSSKIDV